MIEATSRWALYEPNEAQTASGWRLETIVEPARHYPTNGIRVASDGQLWITQVLGRHVTAIDLDTNQQRVAIALGAGLCGPDDLAFDRAGNTFLTEPHDDRVMRATRDGRVEVWADNLPGANGITLSRDGRLFIDECRPGGRLIEVDTREPNRCRVIVGELGMPNALEMGPDGWLYLPEVSANRVLAVDPDTGASRVAVDDVHAPSAVKFDREGRVVVTEAGSGKVTSVELTTGRRQVLAQLAPGLDNLAFSGPRTMCVSSFVTGAIVRIDLERGDVEMLSPPRLVTANGLARSRDGTLLVSDRMSAVAVAGDGSLRRLVSVPVDMQFAIAGALRVGETLCVLTTDGALMRRREGEQSFRKVAIAGITTAADCIGASDRYVLVSCDGAVMAIDPSGEVHRSIATGLRVTAVAAYEKTIVVAARETGTVALFDDRGDSTVWSGFDDPAAVALTREAVFVAECGPRRVLRVERTAGTRTVIATQMPFGSPLVNHANGVGAPSLCADADGSVIVGCSGDASLRRLSPTHG